MPHRWRHLQHTLSDLFQWAYVTLGVALTAVWQVFREVLDLYGELLSLNRVLLAMAIATLLINTGYGLWLALRNGDGFSTEKFGHFFSKTVDYAVTVAVFALLANGSGELGGPISFVFDPLDEFALFLVGVRESNSVAENGWEMGIDGLIRYMYARMRKLGTLGSASQESD